MPRRDYDAARAEHQGEQAEPLDFKLGGEIFLIPLPIPVLPILDLAALGEEGENRNREAEDEQTQAKKDMQTAIVFRNVLLGLLESRDHNRFREACARVRADTDLLGLIVRDVIQDSTGRPTMRPSHSDKSSSNDGPKSKPGGADGETGPSLTAVAG